MDLAGAGKDVCFIHQLRCKVQAHTVPPSTSCIHATIWKETDCFFKRNFSIHKTCLSVFPLLWEAARQQTQTEGRACTPSPQLALQGRDPGAVNVAHGVQTSHRKGGHQGDWPETAAAAAFWELLLSQSQHRPGLQNFTSVRHLCDIPLHSICQRVCDSEC